MESSVVKTIRGVILCLTAIIAIANASASVPEDAPYISIGTIGSLPQTQTSEVTVRATLTLNGDPLYVQDSTGGAAVYGVQSQGLKIGDQLLITGRADNTETGLAFRKSQVHLLWHGTPVPPLSVTADEAALGKFANLLIEVNGRLVDTEKYNGETWLRIESGFQIFLVRIESEQGNPIMPRVENGSFVRVRGVSSLEPRDTRYQGGFAILLRSAEDMAVISGPPWWSLKHLSEIALLFASLIISAHLILVQMMKTRFRVIMAERARMAHELHDTLAQSFAGLSFQIQAAKKIVPKASATLVRHLDLALDMVRHSHSEAHRSIMMLRPQSLSEGTDLHSAIQVSIEQMTAGCQVEFHFTTKGPVSECPLMATDTLYRIAQESAANALRHGHASVLEINLEYTATSVCLTVVDNGDGFDPKAVPGSGFGLAGMQERVRALRGHFNVASALGKGTCVKAEVFLQRTAGVRLVAVLHAWKVLYWSRLNRVYRDKKPDTL